MRNILVLLLSLVFYNQLQAVSPLHPDPFSPFALVAEKHDTKRYYRMGEAVRIVINEGNLSGPVKGYITRITRDSIELSSFNGKGESHTVAISSLQSITRLNRKARKEAGIITAILAVITGILLIASKGNAFESAWGFAIFAIPLIGSAYYLFLYFGFTYLDQLLQRRSVKGGWKFYAAENPPKTRRFFDLFFRRRYL